jgi:hypothetical protein
MSRLALRPTQPPHFMDNMVSFPGRSVKPTTYLHLVPRLRMRGVIPPFPQYVFMAWRLINQWLRLREFYLVKRRDNFTLPLGLRCPDQNTHACFMSGLPSGPSFKVYKLHPSRTRSEIDVSFTSWSALPTGMF